MPSVELKFVPVGYVNPKSETGKTQRLSHLDPLIFASREKNGKFFVVFSMTKLGTWKGTPKLSTEIFNQDNMLVYTGERFFNQAGFDFYSKDRVDISSGIFLKAGEVLDTVEFEPGIATKALHGTAVVVANGIEISNVASFSMGSGLEVTTDPSTSAGYRTNTLKYGYEGPEPQVEEKKTWIVTKPSGAVGQYTVTESGKKKLESVGWVFSECGMYCKIFYNPTNEVAYSGFCSCSLLESYQSDPDYRIEKVSQRETKPDRDVVFKEQEPEITTAGIDPYVPPTEKPFEKPERERVFGPEPEPEITTDHIEPPSEEQDFLPPTSQVDPPVEEEPEITTDHIESPGVEEPEVITSQVEAPGQEVTAQISWFGDTWFPWHLELEDRRRR